MQSPLDFKWNDIVLFLEKGEFPLKFFNFLKLTFVQCTQRVTQNMISLKQWTNLELNAYFVVGKIDN